MAIIIVRAVENIRVLFLRGCMCRALPGDSVSPAHLPLPVKKSVAASASPDDVSSAILGHGQHSDKIRRDKEKTKRTRIETTTLESGQVSPPHAFVGHCRANVHGTVRCPASTRACAHLWRFGGLLATSSLVYEAWWRSLNRLESAR